MLKKYENDIRNLWMNSSVEKVIATLKQRGNVEKKMIVSKNFLELEKLKMW